MKLQDKTILITGASSGIGCELALQLAQKSNRLILLARREELLQQLVQQLARHEPEHLFFPCDVSDLNQVKDVCDRIVAAGIQVDALILNAGLSGGFDVKDINLDSFRNQVEVNFFGAVYFVKYFIPPMLARKDGLIAVNGSLAGYRGMPNAAAYSAAKGALMNFIDSIRIDLHKYHIQCTLISPGFVKTPMTDKNDFSMPFMISAEKAARVIIRGLECRKTEIHFPLRLSILAKLSRHLPDRFYTWMMQFGRKQKK